MMNPPIRAFYNPSPSLIWAASQPFKQTTDIPIEVHDTPCLRGPKMQVNIHCCMDRASRSQSVGNIPQGECI